MRSLEMLAALKGLARSWSQERRAAALLELAAASPDDDVRAAVQHAADEPKEAGDGIE